MCDADLITQVRDRSVANYLAMSKAGTKPHVVFCDETRGTIPNALLDRAEKAPKFAYKASERPGFDKEIAKQPENYYPLLARCHLNHRSDAEANKWLRKQQKKAASDDRDWEAQRLAPSRLEALLGHPPGAIQ
ncbi:hypothetical protein CDV36_015925 [Fusarium kuroshium]|uniref:Uncharacterized protein n=2 Tax=Fusarium solani species complex TaxID=232080 RepID=A0A3M2R5H0_9HYPO|nr:hypothetical protein CDV36_015925 [Fusarium kuroshium]